ncbi:MAG: hypothetical protein WA151_11825 [Desulfatirhabdiaceae bacterium]
MAWSTGSEEDIDILDRELDCSLGIRVPRIAHGDQRSQLDDTIFRIKIRAVSLQGVCRQQDQEENEKRERTLETVPARPADFLHDDSMIQL